MLRYVRAWNSLTFDATRQIQYPAIIAPSQNQDLATIVRSQASAVTVALATMSHHDQTGLLVGNLASDIAHMPVGTVDTPLDPPPE
jgi:hypothetical protein